jgi:hypothetical protein
MSTTITISADAVSKVIAALAKPEFKWRTIAGVAKETSLEKEMVLRIIDEVADQIVKSSVPSSDGQDLYTTREHFRATASIGERLFCAIKNRAA